MRQSTTLTFINLSWAEIGIVESAGFSLSSLRRGEEPIEQAVERYVTGYMAFWGIAFVKEKLPCSCSDKATEEAAQERIRQYVAQHPPVEPLPRFYIAFLNQSHVTGDTDGFGDVLCL